MKILSKLLLSGPMKKGLIFFMSVGISVLNMPMISSAASSEILDSHNYQPQPVAVAADNYENLTMLAQTGPVAEIIWLHPEPVAADHYEHSAVFEPTEPIVVRSAPAVEEDVGLMNDMTMLFVAGGAVALGAAVLIGNNSGGSDSDEASVEPEVEPEPEQTASPEGPDMNGNWAGFLRLNASGHLGYQDISAKVVHEGRSVEISTSTTLDYGRYFHGTINGSGYMYMYESATGEVWTTHKGNASSKQMELYDYVNNYKDYDKMFLYK